MPTFIEQVRNTIERHHMLDGGEAVVIGLSGGADSTALLYALYHLRQQYRLTLYAAHVNHLLRGGESDRDEAFVQALCGRLGIPCFCAKQDVAAAAKASGMSVEAAGHDVRYTYFEEIAQKTGSTRIAVAHNQNDNAETLLLHLTRGCGLAGLCGIPPVNGNIIRPLLHTSRADIEKYLAQNGIAYQTDSTNFSDLYPRNVIRHTVLPALERFNPSASATLAADAARFAADNDFLEQQSDQLCRNCLTIEPGKAVLAAVSLFAAHPALQARAVLRAVAAVTGSTRDISQKHIDAILALSRTGAQFQASNIFVRRTHATLVFTCQKPDTVTYCYPLEPGRPLYIPEIDRTVCCTRCDGIDNPTALYLDADKLSGIPLSVRCRQNGDRFRPAGGHGEKKLKEYLINKKIPVDQRCRIPLLIADGQIAAILGMQAAQPFAPNAKTACFYKLTITGGTTDATSRL